MILLPCPAYMARPRLAPWFGIVGIVALVTGPIFAQAPRPIAAADKAAIEALVTSYAGALGGCRAEAFADLFAPGSGYFASGFRGRS
jgi:hypothetical protein